MEKFKSVIATVMIHFHHVVNFMSHNIPIANIQKHTKSISDTKRTEVSNLQNYIQELLGDTHHTFLQGSYRNDTSTSDISDVDIVAVRVNTYSGTHSSVVVSNSIMWDQIFSEIEAKLKNQSKYSWTVERKDKCIEVKTSSFKADVVPAVQVERDVKNDNITIYSFKSDLEKINFPTTHYSNGVAKHTSTKQNYKPTVRMFKNWALNHFEGLDIVSSYQVESLVYNSKDEKFCNDPATSFILVGQSIVYLLKQRNVLPIAIKSVCGSEDISKNWDINKRQIFCDTLESSVTHALTAYKDTGSNSLYYWNKAFNI